MELHKFGLNKYESLAYTALVQRGMAKAHTIAKQSGVPQGKIYDVLASLEKKGFIKILHDTPKKFLAQEPKIVFNNLLKEKKKELLTFEKESKSMIQKLGSLSRRSQDPLETIRIIKGYKNYLEISTELHKRARKEWLSVTELTIHKEHYDAVKESIKKGLQQKIITYPFEKTKSNVKLWRKIGVEIKFREEDVTQFSVIDQKEVTIRLKDKEYMVIWIKNQLIAKQLRKEFMKMWVKAKK